MVLRSRNWRDAPRVRRSRIFSAMGPEKSEKTDATIGRGRTPPAAAPRRSDVIVASPNLEQHQLEEGDHGGLLLGLVQKFCRERADSPPCRGSLRSTWSRDHQQIAVEPTPHRFSVRNTEARCPPRRCLGQAGSHVVTLEIPSSTSALRCCPCGAIPGGRSDCHRNRGSDCQADLL